MSSILKALEKVEESQNPRRHGGAAGLARGRERRPAWVVPAWALGGAAVATVVTFAIMGGFSRPTAPPVAQQVDKLANSAPVAVAPLNPLPVTPASAPVGTPSAPVRQAATAPAPKALPTQASAPAARSARLPSAAVAQPASVRPAVAQAAPAVATPAVATPAPDATPQVAPEKPRQEVRVTGIAWQREGESSVAMVNGRPVRQGGVVDGFKVEQIYEDSVRFSGINGSLTVPLGGGEEQE